MSGRNRIAIPSGSEQQKMTRTVTKDNAILAGRKRKASDMGSVAKRSRKIKFDVEDVKAKLLTDLDNDSIEVILKYLELEDLANVSQSCHRLKNIAEMVFLATHAATITLKYDSHNFHEQQKVLQHFGGLAKKIKVVMPFNSDSEDDDNSFDFDDDNSDDGQDPLFHGDGDKVLQIISHFGKNVQELILNNYKMDPTSYFGKDRKEIKSFFGKLERLTMINVCTSDHGIFKWTRSLKELIVHNYCDLNKLFEVTLPLLTKLRVGDCRWWLPSAMNENGFMYFLKKNPSIEDLQYDSLLLGDGHLKSICSLPLITAINVPMVIEEDLSSIRDARKLKKVVFRVHPNDDHQFPEVREALPSGCEFSIEVNIEICLQLYQPIPAGSMHDHVYQNYSSQ